MTTFVILLGGHLVQTPRLAGQFAGARFIAADNGMRHAASLGLAPELWVGDFDSTTAELAASYHEVERRTYPAEKAMTDGEIAIAEARLRGATRLVLAGALGGERSDHALAHYVQALALALAGLDVMLTSGEEEAYPLLPPGRHCDLPSGSLFSLVGLEPIARLSIGNARYPLEGFDLEFGSSRTISNIAGGSVTVRFDTGKAILLSRPYDFSGV